MGHAVERVCPADWRRYSDVRGAGTLTFGARTLTSYSQSVKTTEKGGSAAMTPARRLRAASGILR